MNRKTFSMLGLLLASLAVPSLLSAQNLIQNGSFAETVTQKKAYSVDLMSNVNDWIFVSGEWGWSQIAAEGQNFMSVAGPSYSPDGMAAKGLVQCVPDMRKTKGRCTLRFNYFLSKVLAKGQEGCSIKVNVFGFNGAKMPNVNLHGPLEVVSGVTPLARLNLAEAGAKDSWTSCALDVDTGSGYDYILVEFYGTGKTGGAGVDDVAFYSKSGSAPKAAPLPASVPKVTAAGPAPVVAASPAPAVPKPAPVAAPVVKPAPAPVAVKAPAPQPVAVPVPAPITVTASPAPRPVPVPVRPPVDNLVLNGDFSTASLALPTTTGDTTAELSGRWLRSVSSPWEISPYGGNLGPYVRAAASREGSRLLYVANDAKRSQGRYLLHFDYLITDPSDVLGVKVFVSDRDITVGTDGGDFRMNNTQRPGDLVMLPAAAGWTAYHLPVELGNGYNYVYVLFMGSGNGNTGIDNVSLSPQRR